MFALKELYSKISSIKVHYPHKIIIKVSKKFYKNIFFAASLNDLEYKN